MKSQSNVDLSLVSSIQFKREKIKINNNQMKAQTSFLPSQPETHLQSKHWRQCMFCDDYSITKEQLQLFYALKEQANIPFQKNQRWDLIKSLYTQYFSQPPQVSGKQWIRLGFQGQYPETDFRGGGVLSLQLILRFVKRNKDLVVKMQHDKAGFFFAITAINIAFFMKKYFHLADFLVPIKDMQIYCNRRAFKNFCRLLADSEQSYMDMHELFLTYFYNNIWLTAQQINTQTLLQFNALFDSLITRIKQVFEGSQITTTKEFVDIWLTSYQ